MEGDGVYMKLEGKLVHLLAQTDQNFYRKYNTDEKGKTVVSTKLNEGLCSTLQAVMLF